MAAPFRALPPGVYFNPTAEECVRDYLKPWAAGLPPPTDRVICDVDVYSDSPGALLLGREPGFSRGFDHKWLLLSRGRTAAGGGRGSRAVATGGSWQSEQTPKGVADGEDGDESQPRGGRRRSFGFYVGKNGRKRGEKTPWLMEEFTALEDGDGHGRGGGGDGTFAVFCRIYLSPRLEKEDKEKKRQILGDAMVAFDRNGRLKPVRVVVPSEFFDAAARALGLASPPPRVLGFQQAQPARRVLGHQQGQPPPPPPPPPPRVLGFQQAQPARRVLGHQQGQPPPPPPPPPRVLGFQQAQPARRVLGHQQGQPSPPARRALGYHQQVQQPAYPPLLPFLGHQHGQAAVLGDHHGRAMLPPRGPPARHDGDARLPWSVPAVQPHLPHVLHPCYNQEASPEKKPRLAYGSPAPQRQSPGSGPSSCVVHVSPSQQGAVIQFDDDNQCSAEPVAPTPPPQEIPGTTATAGSAEEEPPCDVSAPAPAELAGDAGKAGAEPPMSDSSIYVNLVDIEPFSGYVPDFQVAGEFEPPEGFDDFPLVDLLGF